MAIENSQATNDSSAERQKQNGGNFGKNRPSMHTSSEKPISGFGSLAFQRNQSTIEKPRASLYAAHNIKDAFKRNIKNSSSVMETRR